MSENEINVHGDEQVVEDVQPLEGSETSENNVINEQANEQDLSSDDATDARKFQSMYDKAQAEVEKLQPVAKLFQDNPELVDVVRNHLSGGKGQEEEKVKLTQEEFNPWDAYTDPNSKSFEMRQQEIDAAVSDRMKDYMGRLEAQRAVDNLEHKAQTDFKLSNEDAKDFVNFVTQPREQLPLDTLFSVWNAKNNGTMQTNNNIESVRKTQSIPKSAGLVQGGQPPKMSEDDNMWSNILKAGNPISIGKSIAKK
jgi:hypothetical protein